VIRLGENSSEIHLYVFQHCIPRRTEHSGICFFELLRPGELGKLEKIPRSCIKTA
jgi:hypothetical protein